MGIFKCKCYNSYDDLSPEMKKQAKQTYKLWQENSLHPSLHCALRQAQGLDVLDGIRLALRGFPFYIACVHA